jgi:ArsR family transcriptional regulator
VVDERQVAELRRLAPTRAELSEVCEILDAAHAEVLAEVLRALANPTRLRLVAYLLCHGESTVGELARELGTAQAATSQALGALRLGGQVCVRRAGGFRYYSAAVPDLAVLLTCLSRCCRLHVRAPTIAASGGAGEVR